MLWEVKRDGRPIREPVSAGSGRRCCGDSPTRAGAGKEIPGRAGNDEGQAGHDVYE